MTKKTARFYFGDWFRTKAISFLSSGSSFSQGLYGEIRQPLNGVALSGLRVSVDSLFTVWRNHGDVFACVRELKENVGSQGYIWVNKFDSNEKADPVQIKMAEEFLNYGRTFRSLKNLVIQNQQISGNAYLLVLKSADGKGRALGLDVIDPRTISVVTDEYGTIIKWIQRVKSQTQDFNPEEVLHFKQHDDPNSPVFGLSPLEPIIWEARTDLSAMINNYALMANDATPGAQYILEEGMSAEDQEKVVEEIRNQLQGPENRNKSIAIRGVKEIKTIQISPKDMEHNVTRKFSTEKICAGFGVPKAILNYTDGVNYSNGENQTQKFWEGTITPLQDLWAEFINKDILPILGVDKIKIEYNTKTFSDKQWDEASSRADVEHGIITINEAREKRGFTPYDQADHGEFVDRPVIWNGQTVKPLEDLGIDMNPDGTPTILSEDQAKKEIGRISRIAQHNNLGKKSGLESDQAAEKRIREKLSKEFEIKEKNLKMGLAKKLGEALRD